MENPELRTMNNESCVETPAAPEWLSKLESRREKLTKAKLGHEVGAGAPCNECGDKCPGLDLHFWRKVCRNCKCRKDQHSCTDDDLSGWAQFEILGQIRSKPAYIKIKALAEQPVKVDWIPPNATPDIVSEYMNKLGSKHIPVAGSDAAAKRKQQLEFQVPPHDLDARLCDNLSESETAQLQQYVEKIRENCVGQGNVVRISNETHNIIKSPSIGMQTNEDIRLGLKYPPAEILQKLNITPATLVKDRILMNILNSERLTNALLSPQNSSPLLIAFSKPIQGPLAPIYANLTNSNNSDKLNEMNLNQEMVKSFIENGPAYEKILSDLEAKGIDFSKDPVLQSIDEFRKKYLNDDKFKQDMERYVKLLSTTPYSTPIKTRPITSSDILNSPLPLKPPINPKIGVTMKQDTPMRKVKFGGVNVAYLLGLPVEANIEKDKLLSMIVNSEAIRNVLQQNSAKLPSNSNLIVSNEPLIPSYEEFINSGLSTQTKNKINDIGLNKYAIQSGVINGPMYDQLFSNLKARGVNYGNCKLLAPMEQFRQEFINNVPFQNEIIAFVEKIPNSYSIALSEPISNAATYFVNNIGGISGPSSNPQSPFKSKLHNSKSTDSGFESKPPTPNYATFPGVLPLDTPQQQQLQFSKKPVDSLHLLDIDAMKGKFASIPGIEDMNMYPHVEPSLIPLESLNDSLSNLNITQNPDNYERNRSPIPILKCKDCLKDIWSGEVAVKAERAGKESAWHPECFKCHECRELLADLVYFFHDGNVYCGRDLAIILKIPRCNACDELIFTKNYTMAEGSTFHIKHFCCYQCDIPLAGQEYVPDEKTNMPLCLNCYNQYYAEKCQLCKNIIGPTEQGVSWGKIHWHGNCFNCQGINCGKSLLGGRFCVKNNMPFCSPQCVKSVIF